MTTPSILYSSLFNTTNATSSKWENVIYDKTTLKLLSTLKVPIYHIVTKEWTDMGPGRKGRREPYVDSIDVYIWSSKESKPIVYEYSVDPQYKSSVLRTTYTEYADIKVLRGQSDDDYDYYDDEDEDEDLKYITAHQLYNEICKVLGVECVAEVKTATDVSELKDN